MWGSRCTIRAGRVARTVMLLAIGMPSAVGLVLAGSAAPALACNTSAHCYAEAVDADGQTNYGVQAQIDSTCLHVTDDGNFANQEIWDADSTDSYWEEVGITSGSLGTYTADKTWFWADSRPNGGYNAHFPSVDPASSNVNYTVLITYDGDEQWSIWGGNSYTLLGASTGQSATISQPIAGTEYTSYAGSDTQDAGNVNSLTRIATNGD
jgi:hypothetical protein